MAGQWHLAWRGWSDLTVARMDGRSSPLYSRKVHRWLSEAQQLLFVSAEESRYSSYAAQDDDSDHDLVTGRLCGLLGYDSSHASRRKRHVEAR